MTLLTVGGVIGGMKSVCCAFMFVLAGGVVVCRFWGCYGCRHPICFPDLVSEAFGSCFPWVGL